MRKKLYYILSSLEIIALIGAYLVHYFTKRKMGMARYVVYVSQKIEKNYPIDIIKYLAVILIIALTIFVLVKLFKINKIKLAVLTLLSSSLFVGFTMAKL